jgi:hypothetical protein
MLTFLKTAFSGVFQALNLRPVSILAAAVACFSLGWTANGWRWEARVSAIEKAVSADAASRAEAVSEALERARALEARGDAIAARLLAAEAAQTRLGKEKDDAIRALAAGRPCLAGPLVGLLNGSSGSGAGLRLPPASGGAAPAASAPAADPGRSGGIAAPHASLRPPPPLGSASDTAVALWARNARDAHDACRARINALREFHEGMP